LEKKIHISIEEYYESLDSQQLLKLQELHNYIKKIVPEAEEKISYNMPSFHLNGPLVYIAAYKNHIGFYPTPSPIVAFQNKLLSYKTSKGAIQFPINEKFPLALIKSILLFRKKELLNKEKK